MNPTDSQFASLDRQLAAKAGIGDKGRIILQFYPPEAQAILVSSGTETCRYAQTRGNSQYGLPRHPHREQLSNSAWKTRRTGKQSAATSARCAAIAAFAGIILLPRVSIDHYPRSFRRMSAEDFIAELERRSFSPIA